MRGLLNFLDGTCVTLFVVTTALLIATVALVLASVAYKICTTFPDVLPTVIGTLAIAAILRGGYLFVKDSCWR